MVPKTVAIIMDGNGRWAKKKEAYQERQDTKRVRIQFVLWP